MRYVKGDVDKGNVLKTVDEITLVIEDMTLTLQSMLASRFVKPFLQDVQLWEKKLSLIAEVIEIWMEVQRKWMYPRVNLHRERRHSGAAARGGETI